MTHQAGKTVYLNHWSNTSVSHFAFWSPSNREWTQKWAKKEDCFCCAKKKRETAQWYIFCRKKTRKNMLKTFPKKSIFFIIFSVRLREMSLWLNIEFFIFNFFFRFIHQNVESTKKVHELHPQILNFLCNRKFFWKESKYKFRAVRKKDLHRVQRGSKMNFFAASL